MNERLADLHIADLHARAAELEVDRFRLLGRDELIEAIERAGERSDADRPSAEPGEGDTAEREPRRSRRGRRRRRKLDDEEAKPEDVEPIEPPAADLGAAQPVEADTDEVPVAAAAEEAEAGEGDEEGREGDEEGAETSEVSGVLELTRQGFGFLRVGGLEPHPDDVYVSASQVRRCELRAGDELSGPARAPRRDEGHPALVQVESVNGEEPLAGDRREFDSLAPVLPERRLPLDRERDDVLLRAVDLLVPIALGQRVLIRATPRSGRTGLLRGIARAAAAIEGVQPVVLLVDERPEEATVWREAVPEAEFAVATADLAPRDQLHVAELALERARRIAERGGDAVLVCDSLSRLAVAAGDAVEAKRLFGSGRNTSEGGSLTVVATVLEGGQDGGDAERAVATTESALVTLDRGLAAAGVYPAIRAAECGVSNEEQLREAEELEAARRLRGLIADLAPSDAAALLREQIGAFSTNAELLASLE